MVYPQHRRNSIKLIEFYVLFRSYSQFLNICNIICEIARIQQEVFFQIISCILWNNFLRDSEHRIYLKNQSKRKIIISEIWKGLFYVQYVSSAYDFWACMAKFLEAFCDKIDLLGRIQLYILTLTSWSMSDPSILFNQY